jgi:hypothetical protein
MALGSHGQQLQKNCRKLRRLPKFAWLWISGWRSTAGWTTAGIISSVFSRCLISVSIFLLRTQPDVIFYDEAGYISGNLLPTE